MRLALLIVLCGITPLELRSMVATRGARAIILHRHTADPLPPSPSPAEPCCNECKGTGKWKPDGNVLVDCPCPRTCPCKAARTGCASGTCPPKSENRR